MKKQHEQQGQFEKSNANNKNSNRKYHKPFLQIIQNILFIVLLKIC
jgi:hypothetical protein